MKNKEKVFREGAETLPYNQQTIHAFPLGGKVAAVRQTDEGQKKKGLAARGLPRSSTPTIIKPIKPSPWGEGGCRQADG